MRCRWLAVCSLSALTLAACASQPTEQVIVGDLLSETHFDQPTDWEQYANEQQHVNFRIENRAYRAEAWDNGFIWVLNDEMHTDVVIQVDAQQQSEYANNAYGVMCRATPSNNGDGYYFLISGDGQYTIRRGKSDQIAAIIPWTPTDAIQQGRALNRIRATCVDDYLALSVNGTFVAETRDDFHPRGFAGLVAGVPADGTVDVVFDDVRIWSASLPDATESP